MFLVAGVSPRLVTIDETPQRCAACGFFQAQQQRIDHYFSLFFIPLLRVKKGETFLSCRRCQHNASAFAPPRPPPTPAQNVIPCGGCGHLLQSDFRFCPHCGRTVP